MGDRPLVWSICRGHRLGGQTPTTSARTPGCSLWTSLTDSAGRAALLAGSPPPLSGNAAGSSRKLRPVRKNQRIAALPAIAAWLLLTSDAHQFIRLPVPLLPGLVTLPLGWSLIRLTVDPPTAPGGRRRGAATGESRGSNVLSSRSARTSTAPFRPARLRAGDSGRLAGAHRPSGPARTRAPRTGQDRDMGGTSAGQRRPARTRPVAALRYGNDSLVPSAGAGSVGKA
jgi:hypothetical protein